MRYFLQKLIFILIILFSSISFAKNKKNLTIPFTIIQINDVYELMPIGNNKRGGLTKIAGLKKQLEQSGDPVFVMLAGDLVNPSSLSSARINDKPFYGQQMVDVANNFLDYMIFGNHEFDIPEEDLKKRIKESKFIWVSSNVLDKNNKPFEYTLINDIKPIRYKDKTVNLGIFSLTLNKNKKPWVNYNDDYIGVAKQQIAELKKKGAEIIIALTHLNFENDVDLASELPEIDIIMGGHEHENIQTYRGSDLTPIYKADSNAITAYIHRFQYNKKSKRLKINSELRIIDDRIKNDPKTLEIANKWMELAKISLQKQGIELGKKLTVAKKDLDGKKDVIRATETELTKLIGDSFIENAKSDLAIFNEGMVRIEDVIPEGNDITTTDVLRILPFEIKIVKISAPGTTLLKILEQSAKSRGGRGFIHVSSNVSLKNKEWYLNNKKIDPNQTYTIASSDYVISGRSTFLKLLKDKKKYNIKILNENVADARIALIQKLQEHDK